VPFHAQGVLETLDAVAGCSETQRQRSDCAAAVGALGLSIDVDAFFVDAGQLQLKHHGGAWCGG
jgi:hypothetical protein